MRNEHRKTFRNENRMLMKELLYNSGGPMICEDKNGRAILQGVVSGGLYEECRKNKQGEFANVNKYINFIKKNSLVNICTSRIIQLR